jgi:lysophospholipase L1-like esterase
MLTKIAEKDFTGESNTSFGAAGSTTGAAGFLVDVGGSAFKIVSGRLEIHCNGGNVIGLRPNLGDGGDDDYSLLAIKIIHQLDEWDADGANNCIPWIILGADDAADHYYIQSTDLTDSGGTYQSQIYAFQAFSGVGASIPLSAASLATNAPVAHWFERTSVGPSNFTSKAESPVGTVVLNVNRGSNNAAGYQIAGRAGILLQPNAGSGDRVMRIRKIEIWADAGVDPVAAGDLSITALNAESADVAVSAPSGGTEPYSVTLYSDPEPDFTPSGGNDIDTQVGDAIDFPLSLNIPLDAGEVQFVKADYTDGSTTDSAPQTLALTPSTHLGNAALQSEINAYPDRVGDLVIAGIGDSIIAGQSAVSSNDPDTNAMTRARDQLATVYVGTVTAIDSGEPTTTTEEWLPDAAAGWPGHPDNNLLEDAGIDIDGSGLLPDAIFIKLGANDGNQTHGIAAATYAANLTEIASWVLTDASWAARRTAETIVILCPVAHVDSNNAGMAGIVGVADLARYRAYNALLPDVADDVNVAAGAVRCFVGDERHYRAFMYRISDRLRLVDGLHPQIPEGYHVFGDLMALDLLGNLTGVEVATAGRGNPIWRQGHGRRGR